MLRMDGPLFIFERFDDILFNLTSLTKLELLLWPYSFEVTTNEMHLDRILEAMPNLLDLKMTGCDYEPIPASSPMLDPKKPLYKLQSFTFQVDLLQLQGSANIRIFQRLGNLVSISVRGYINAGWNLLISFSLVEAARTFQELCPNIKSFEAAGVFSTYLYFLPESYSSSNLHVRGKDVEEQERVEEFQRDQILEALEVFPRITKVQCSIAGEDLRCWGLRAQFLTHVELRQPTNGPDGLWDVPDETFSGDYHLEGNNAAQRWYEISRLDLQLFLETCRHLRHFDADRRTIYLEHMTPPGTRLSGIYYSPKERHQGRCPVIRAAKPWACEGTLQTLLVGFRIYSAVVSDHRIAYGQLGRCNRLRHLSMPRSNLIPTLRHGVDLLEGLKETLCAVPSLSSEWVCDDLETLAWMAKTFVKVKTLNVNVRSG